MKLLNLYQFYFIFPINDVFISDVIFLSMSLIANLPIFCNLCGEMIYIIQQRLSTYKIEIIQSAQIQNEIICAMTEQYLIDDLISLQNVYSMSSMKRLFERIAQSSTMKLTKRVDGNDSKISTFCVF
ncbi:hypothetical protein HK096_000697 [Nowakowskiella sp. JEL0078]|nr:hypothetical protein HK096_000697 [Nowakowskiella sp. JEL0078]